MQSNITVLGYQAQGEYGISFRRYCYKGAAIRTHHIHTFEQNNPEIEGHIKYCHG